MHLSFASLYPGIMIQMNGHSSLEKLMKFDPVRHAPRKPSEMIGWQIINNNLSVFWVGSELHFVSKGGAHQLLIVIG